MSGGTFAEMQCHSFTFIESIVAPNCLVTYIILINTVIDIHNV